MIHGSGVVRAGQWARRLIINEDLDKGTMLPYIKHIQSRGWGVVVMNTNHNYDDDGESIPGSESPEKHAVTVWKEVLAEASATEIVVIAHSYGGVVTMALARNKEVRKDFEKRVHDIIESEKSSLNTDKHDLMKAFENIVAKMHTK